MDFAGPEAADFANVRSLNRAFLALAHARRLPRGSLHGLDERLRKRLQGLNTLQASRLASTPFLLFSLRERDAKFWEQLFSAAQNRDLFAEPPAGADDFARLTAAGLGFLWQLAQRNPYTARVVAGASLNWCEQIGERTFFQLLAIAGLRDDLLVLRFAGDSGLWSKLLEGGVMREDFVRRSIHVSALQTLLTHDRIEHRHAWPVAARKIDRPGTRVAEDSTGG
jgi:hypothetical protein